MADSSVTAHVELVNNAAQVIGSADLIMDINGWNQTSTSVAIVQGAIQVGHDTHGFSIGDPHRDDQH